MSYDSVADEVLAAVSGGATLTEVLARTEGIFTAPAVSLTLGDLVRHRHVVVVDDVYHPASEVRQVPEPTRPTVIAPGLPLPETDELRRQRDASGAALEAALRRGVELDAALASRPTVDDMEAMVEQVVARDARIRDLNAEVADLMSSLGDWKDAERVQREVVQDVTTLLEMLDAPVALGVVPCLALVAGELRALRTRLPDRA